MITICQELKSASNLILCTWNLVIIKIVINGHEYDIALYFYGSESFKAFHSFLFDINNKQLCREDRHPSPQCREKEIQGKRSALPEKTRGPGNPHLEPAFLPLQWVGQMLSLGSLKAGEIWIKPFIYLSSHPFLPGKNPCAFVGFPLPCYISAIKAVSHIGLPLTLALSLIEPKD